MNQCNLLKKGYLFSWSMRALQTRANCKTLLEVRSKTKKYRDKNTISCWSFFVSSFLLCCQSIVCNISQKLCKMSSNNLHKLKILFANNIKIHKTLSKESGQISNQKKCSQKTQHRIEISNYITY